MDKVGQTTCFPCTPGMFGGEEGGANCTECPRGYYSARDSNQEGIFECKKANANAIVLPGESAAVDIPKGSYRVCEAGTDASCTKFEACPSGWFEVNRTCEECVRGRTSFSGATSCHNCETGKFADAARSEKCKSCDTEDNRYSDKEGAESCKTCPAGFVSIGKKCSDMVIDSSLPVPTEVVVARATSRDWSEIKVLWKEKSAFGTAGAFEVQLSSSSGFYRNDVETFVYSGREISRRVLDTRVAVTFARVRAVRGGQLGNVGEWSAISKPWMSTSDSSCSAEGYYLNESDLIPSNWKCSECPSEIKP